ncbi:MAG TPA: DEAD/DEAH box helicase [Telluria sp.]|nr:DEAD/DEAH box helicase [Telluria sp.]
MPLHFTPEDILSNFDSGTYGRGRDYAQRGKVRGLLLGDPCIAGEVSGSGGQLYHQSIRVQTRRGRIRFDGDCSCPMQSNCKHVVAVLIRCLDQISVRTEPSRFEPALSEHASAWLVQVQRAVDDASASVAKRGKSAQRLVYVLIPDRDAGRVEVQLCKARVSTGGAIASASVFNDIFSLLNYSSAAGPADLHAARLFVAMSAQCSLFTGRSEARGAAGADFIRLVRDRGCLGWAAQKRDLKAGPVHRIEAGPAREGGLAWRARGGEAGLMHLDWQFADGGAIDFVLPTEPPMYVRDGLLGELILPSGAQAIPLHELQMLAAAAPHVSVHDAAALARQLTAQGLGQVVPLPPAARQVTRTDVRPRPFLFLGSRRRAGGAAGQPQWDDHAVLGFVYDGERISVEPSQVVERKTAAGSEIIMRDAARELAAHDALAALGFRAPPADTVFGAVPGVLQLAHANDWLRFNRHDLPLLREGGWLIEQDPAYRFDLAEVEDWYADVEPGSDSTIAWFDLELGIVVNGDRVALLPVLLQLIRSAPHEFDAAVLDAHRDDDLLIARLTGDMQVGLPWGRIKPILRTLGELYFTEQAGESLRLPVVDAARLAELEASAQLRWTGAEQLREMGRRLRAIGSAPPIAAPLGLQASLRPYQHEGLAWMQFLREFNLGGILADDMGLGKTIQTLAHILLEKEAGRLTAPALVVAPTSLMGNWQAEAARFAPGLRVLLLHGADRLARFDEIGQHDLVLTTYALLARDEERLRLHRYHLLILDESQYIKNSRAKAAQTAALLPAQHRLCLTGTPLQNHLGELWAQFHFLVPGLLGDEKTFNAVFRKPIEKLGDAGRNAFLVQRIKPFLLRRTKDAVATELPAKTEMVREVELCGAQRDLYETMRVAMDKKVRDAIASKGVARSQIIILDALLKLRQVCCDPRLVKLAGHQARGAPSAKLDQLMEMIVALLDEGRKILVFSQFTSMLALIEAELRERAIAYALLTGETKDRTGEVAAFQQGQVPLFLISLKAGGVGLNLTAADTVIHYDPWWNPAVESQATDRAWRIGQDKPVFVYKLIAKGTLEEKIQELQRRKSELADAVLAGGAANDLALTHDDLAAILAPL